MADIFISQTEADALIKTEKEKVDDQNWEYPSLGGSISIPLVSTDTRENFLLDIGRGRIDLLKGKYQNRARQIIVLVRLDFGGAPHRNPDGEEVGTPHLHIYREGYGDKWAETVPVTIFQNLSDPWKTLSDFMNYCKIVKPPNIHQGFFP